MGYIFLIQPEHTSIMSRTQTPWADGVITGTNFWNLPAHPGVDIPPRMLLAWVPAGNCSKLSPWLKTKEIRAYQLRQHPLPRGSPHAPAMGLLSISPRAGQAASPAEISLAFQHESPSQTL